MHLELLEIVSLLAGQAVNHPCGSNDHIQWKDPNAKQHQ